MTFHKPVATTGEDLEARAGDSHQRLVCHYCGFRRSVPKTCPKCSSEHLYYLGAGSQQGEERLQELFPSARIGRMDRDTVRGRSDMERLLARLHAGEINLLVGTQMIAKGHDIHGVTLVGVVGADTALGLPDFRAAERVFQLLTQVSGRAGRGDLPGKVLLQTYHPDHYAIQFATQHDYPGFVQKELQYRRWMHYPPFAVLANVIVQSSKLEEATAWATALGRWFQQAKLEKIRVLGPAPAPIVRLKRIFRYPLCAEGGAAAGAGQYLARDAGVRGSPGDSAAGAGDRCGRGAPDVGRFARASWGWWLEAEAPVDAQEHIRQAVADAGLEGAAEKKDPAAEQRARTR